MMIEPDTAKADGRGLVLMIAGQQPTYRRGHRLASTGGALTAWVGVSPADLLPDALADVVHLPVGSAPQSVRGYLERAARTRGPVLIYITGHLVPDKRGELHLALRETTAAAVRYDGLPWSWIADTLRPRKGPNTLVIADLTAEPETGRALVDDRTRLSVDLPLWGVVNPPPSGDAPVASWTRTLVIALRRGFARQPLHVDPAHIHHDITACAALPGALEWVPAPGTTLPLINGMPGVPDSIPPAGEPVTLAGPSALPLLPTDLTTRDALHTDPLAEAEPPPAPSPYDDRRATIEEIVEDGHPEQAIPIALGISVALDEDCGPLDVEALRALDLLAWLTALADRPAAAVPLYTKLAHRYLKIRGRAEPHRGPAAAEAAYALWQTLDDDSARRLAGDIATLQAALPGEPTTAAAVRERLARFATPAGSQPTPTPPVPVVTVSPALATPAPAPEQASQAPTEALAAVEQIRSLAQAGQVEEALTTATVLIGSIAREHGPDHPHTLNARDVYGFLLAEAGRYAEAATLYADVARRRHRRADHPGAAKAADNAHAMWDRMPDGSAQTARIGRTIVDLRRDILSPRLALDAARTRLQRLTAPTPTAPSPAAAPEPAIPAYGPERQNVPASDPAVPEHAAENGPPTEAADLLEAVEKALADGEVAHAANLADVLASGLEEQYGPDHPHTLQAREVQAHTTAGSGNAADATMMYLRLAQWHAVTSGAHSPGAVRASDAAAALWQHLGPTPEALTIGPEIVDLRTHVPGSDPNAGKAAQTHWENLCRAAARR
ncbi:tetratricopeptide repeat protein [Yinghuangia sp. ASG 101]|uniref:tetratricopeptide repeat protein n=1 Tax=Yinghuangia sp. ASG 101 TaxID=2896848 RepID=UPI001E5025F9|nr:tetratricopeptide repeat protein [Yinghuangia sp. ASG 101]UGQ14987.1 tetratricopeptide repeat protein [Yinghuangia sp. ASG 101]